MQQCDMTTIVKVIAINPTLAKQGCCLCVVSSCVCRALFMLS